jgi:hypothetical protein
VAIIINPIALQNKLNRRTTFNLRRSGTEINVTPDDTVPIIQTTKYHLNFYLPEKKVYRYQILLLTKFEISNKTQNKLIIIKIALPT